MLPVTRLAMRLSVPLLLRPPPDPVEELSLICVALPVRDPELPIPPPGPALAVLSFTWLADSVAVP